MPHEPKKKHSKAVKRTRRAAKMITAVSLLVCKNCHQKTFAHMACRNCGFYGSKKIGEEQVKVIKA